MTYKATLAIAASLLAAACTYPQSSGPVHTDTTPSVAFQPGENKLDLAHGTWGTQPITPPSGLVTVRDTNLIGRTVEAAGGTPFLTVKDLLVEPTTGDARYAVTTANAFGDYLVVPLSVMQITPTAVRVDATAETLKRMPRFTAAELESRYPRTALRSAVVLPPPAEFATAIPPLTPSPLPAVQPAGRPLELVRSGSVVRYPVIDSDGRSVGVVEAVSAEPATGEVRYAIISGPRFGRGYYIAVPAGNMRLAGSQVVLNAPLAAWLQEPRYRDDQLEQRYGAPRSLN